MLIQSIFMNILAIILVCWLGHVTSQSSADDQELEIGSKGEGPPQKEEFHWDNNNYDLGNTY
ncbi:uncharacterized protein LOC108111924 [Drosophila eugracilis]|uniref:uncharacterized protein LOC108111924 n=1 Tax=Drosophila eugracilis TaxID=29029 RepID=UPI001BDB0291|nr:uncharacterized protein LOC108111924 [Drosophila eugracilis]